MLIGCTKSPKSDWTSAELGKPAFKLGLSGIVRQAAQMKDLAALRQKRSNVGAGIHGFGENVRVFLWWLAFANETSENAGEGDRFLHSPSR